MSREGRRSRRASVLRLGAHAAVALVTLVALVALAGCAGESSANPGAERPAGPTATTGTGASAPTPTPTPAMAPAVQPSTAAATPTPTPAAASGSVSPTPANGPTETAGLSGDYLDDRSTPVAVIRSYYNAINRKEYARAYSYWEAGASPDQVPPYDQFAQGYAKTASVQLTTGSVKSDVGAGQLYWAVPIALVATTTDGKTQTFVGCYRLHLARPELQQQPPFHPIAIQSATVQEVPPGSATTAQAERSCGV